jgi:hypothetical protein
VTYCSKANNSLNYPKFCPTEREGGGGDGGGGEGGGGDGGGEGGGGDRGGGDGGGDGGGEGGGGDGGGGESGGDDGGGEGGGELAPFDGWACRIMASTCALSATVLLAFAGLQVPISLSTSPSFPTRPPTPCEAMGGACIARTSPGLGQCRTDDVIAANRAFTFATEHEQLVQNFANTDNHHAYLLCEEPYSCCIEDACESVLGGVCQDSAIDAPDGHKYYSGYCTPPPPQARRPRDVPREGLLCTSDERLLRNKTVWGGGGT